VNAALGRVGIALVSRHDAARIGDRLTIDARYAAALSELEGAVRAQYFPDLPARPNRTAQLAALLGTGAAEGLFLAGWLARSLAVEGDVCEFGVAQGRTSAFLAGEILGTTRRLWLFDSFEGLSAPTAEDVLLDDIWGLGAVERYAGTMACSPALVERALREAGFPEERVRIVKGVVSRTLAGADVPAAVSFAYVDVDFYEPTKRILAFLDRATTPGGRIVVDDYGFFSAGVQQAVDEFTAARPERWICHPPPAFAGHFAVLERTARSRPVPTTV
jgi:hypothetical protein